MLFAYLDSQIDELVGSGRLGSAAREHIIRSAGAKLLAHYPDAKSFFGEAATSRSTAEGQLFDRPAPAHRQARVLALLQKYLSRQH